MGLIFKGIFSGLTPAEKWFLIKHPTLIDDISDLADVALAEARRRFPGAGQHNGNGDAFRHCYWSSLLARDIGAENAREFTTAHEAYDDNPAGERAMDLHNNGIGIGLGTGSSETNAQLSNRCAAELTNGTLLTAPPSIGSPY